jgi:large subunit ribosomal protein L25
VDMKHKLTVEVSLRFIGKPIGVDNGGELQHIKRELKVSCLPANLPDHIDVDVAALDIGDSIKVRELTIPEGITVLDLPDSAVASVAIVKIAKVEEPVAEAVVTEEGAEAAAEGAEAAEAAEPTEKAEKPEKEKKEKREK